MEPRYTLLPAALLLTVFSHAQPTIAWGDAPTNGDIVSYSNVECTPTITTGAGQTWVFTGPTSPGFDLSFVSPGASPGHTNWPDATVAAQQDDYEYYTYLKVDATGLYIIGGYDNSDGALEDYIDTQRFMAYPCTFGTTWTDGFSTSPVVNGTPDYFQDPQTYTADGYGTLVGNAGNMTNVLKVHEEEVNDTTVDGVQYLDVSVQDLFWKPGYPLYVASVFVYISIVGGEVQYSGTDVQMIDQLAIGIPEVSSQDIGISLAPNPANDEVSMAFGAVGDATITIQDALGRAVLTVERKSLAPGIHREVLDVGTLPPGTFVVRVVMADGQTGTRKLVITK